MTDKSWSPDRPHDHLLALSKGESLETPPVLRACIEARAALAALKEVAEQIPNQGMLINTLPFLEAQASSEIENIVTTTDKLFQNLGGRERDLDPATKEALRYRQAVMEGLVTLADRPLCTATAEVICTRIRGVKMSVREVPGTKLVDGQSGRTIYTPPEGEPVVRELLADWERFMNSPSELDPLIRMAAGHFQFEAIHPFTDGNGRTGRILNSLFLIQEGLLSLPILYLSRYIIANRAEYYRRLVAVTREQAWEEWLLYMIEGVRETATWTRDKIGAIRELSHATAEYARRQLPKIYSRELIDVLFAQPYCRIANLVEASVAKRQTAARYLKAMVEIGVLQERKVGREKIFVHPRLMDLLTKEQNTFHPLA
jgi:Fic family protein